MAGLNNFWKYAFGQTIDFKHLFKSSENFSRDHYRVTIQDELRDMKAAKKSTQQTGSIIKKSYKRVPIVKGNEDEKEDKKQPNREEQKLARKQQAERREKLSGYDKEKDIPQNTRAGYLPLREAVIFSEIIGAPRCKSRYRRRRQ